MFPPLLKLFEDPVGIALCKCASLFDRANPRNCCSDGAVLLDADDVATRSVIAGKLDGDGLGVDLQGIHGSTAIFEWGEEEVHLHALIKSGRMHVGNTRWV